jgi:hypothetical protein
MGGILRTLLAAFGLLLTATTTQAQWEIEDSHTTASLRGITNVGGGIAWASGTGGTVLRTRDDGKTWRTCPIPLAGTNDTAEKLDFRGIQAFDEKTAIVMSSGPGDQSRLYKTTDGCQTWKLLFTNPDKDGFWDSLNGDRIILAVVGDPVAGQFPVFYSRDNGNTWARFQDHKLAAQKGEGGFAASNCLLLPPRFTTELSVRFVTGGTSGAYLHHNRWHWIGDFARWQTSEATKLPLGGASSSGAFSIEMGCKDSGFAQTCPVVVVGGDYQKPDQSDRTAIFASIPDHSQNFTDFKPAQTPPHGYRSAVAYDANEKSWITVGPNGTDISTDDGRNWRPLTPTSQDAPDADKNWNALSLPFVVGPKGRIGKLRATALGSVRMVKPGAR